MKSGIIVLSIIFVAMNFNSALADSKRGRSYKTPYRGHGQSYNNPYRGHGQSYNKHNRGYGHYPYGPSKYYGDYYGDYALYALGGLIIGGIIGSTLSNTYNDRSRYSTYSEQVYVNPYPVNSATKPTYTMQPNGICYVVNYVNNGNLVLSPVPSGNCR
ncbi:MAG: hypothetical protein KAQ91_10185 [Methylococcales bacterium]|nr:hypothetical protein [Methylococcales bacterium]